MPHIICPKCSADIRLFSPQWQSQRAAENKTCPTCGSAVEIVMNGKRFTAWLLGSGAVIVALMLTAKMPWPAAAFFGFMLGTLVAAVPSLEARAPTGLPKGIRAMLYRPLPWPRWLAPSPAVRALGRGVWAMGGFIAILLALVLSVPQPWAGFLLAAYGLLCHWQKSVWFQWFKLQGLAAQLYSAAAVLSGLALVAAHYA